MGWTQNNMLRSCDQSSRSFLGECNLITVRLTIVNVYLWGIKLVNELIKNAYINTCGMEMI